MNAEQATRTELELVPVNRVPQSTDERVHRWGRRWQESRPARLSILMAAYNEERTITSAVRAVLDVEYPCEVELIVVDDGSSDLTPVLLSEFDDSRLVMHRHQRNAGKGAALLTAADLATGTHILPFDADLEYDAADIPRLLEPVLLGRCDVVYGTRLFGLNTVYQSYRYAMGNRFTTLAANVLYDANLADLHTCLKLVPITLFRSLRLKADGFGLDTEITARLLRLGVRPFEVSVSYHSRSHDEGKKITWRDGLDCLLILGRVRLARRSRMTSADGMTAARTRANRARATRAKAVGKEAVQAEPARAAAVMAGPELPDSITGSA